MKEYKARKKRRDAQAENRLQAADCKTSPETPFAGRKIIPFPGVILSEPDRFQTGFDNFLREIGYIE